MQVDHSALVQALHAQYPPEHTVEGALAFTVRVIRALPASEGAGLLSKPAGENIAVFGGYMVSAGRVCYPDGQLYKVLSDIPTTMAPIWNDDGIVDPAKFVPVASAPPAPTPEPPPTPTPPGAGDDLDDLLLALERIANGVEGLAVGVHALADRVSSLETNGVRLRIR